MVALEDDIRQGGANKGLATIIALADEVVELKDGCVVQAVKVPSVKQADVSSSPAAVDIVPAHSNAPLGPDAIDALDPKRQQGDWSVYGYYFNAAGRFEVILFLALMVLWTACESFSGGFSKLFGPWTLANTVIKQFGLNGGQVRTRRCHMPVRVCILECVLVWELRQLFLWLPRVGRFHLHI